MFISFPKMMPSFPLRIMTGHDDAENRANRKNTEALLALVLVRKNMAILLSFGILKRYKKPFVPLRKNMAGFGPNEMHVKKDLLADAVRQLAQSGIESALYEAQLLLDFAVNNPSDSGRKTENFDRSGFTRPRFDRLALLQLEKITPAQEERFRQLLARRVAREPMAFILGEQGFWTLDFEVSPASLIPRGDSEALIEALILARPDRQSVRSVLDLGTGTGCLLLSALSEYPHAFGTGVDIAPDAVRLAERNAAKNNLAHRAHFLEGDWTIPVQGIFDVILSNPPYIEAHIVPTLMPEVAQYEPHRALAAGVDGLEAYRRICAGLPEILHQTGCVVLELGQGQKDAVCAIVESCGLKPVFCHHDLGGVERALVLEHLGQDEDIVQI